MRSSTPLLPHERRFAEERLNEAVFARKELLKIFLGERYNEKLPEPKKEDVLSRSMMPLDDQKFVIFQGEFLGLEFERSIINTFMFSPDLIHVTFPSKYQEDFNEEGFLRFMVDRKLSPDADRARSVWNFAASWKRCVHFPFEGINRAVAQLDEEEAFI